MEYLHYIIIGIIIVVIVYYQVKEYLSTLSKIELFQEIFPKWSTDCGVIISEENGLVTGIVSDHSNPILSVIIESINKYLNNNRGSISDFHLMRDIVDRNCDTAEEEINTQVPVPLYYGLMGTMFGIFVGVGFLVFTGGLQELLGSGTSFNGANGISALLSGVALAMISSIVGIFLTTLGSAKIKDCKVEVDRTKNVFLSWIHSELLPELSSDMNGAFEKMTRNLTTFNSTFSTNTKELRNTLGVVNESYKGQSELLHTINQLKIRDIASANIGVYDKLKNCTDEIGYFGTYLHSVNEYINNVRKLNDKLDSNESRTKAIEDMGTFFKEERANMQVWNGIVSKSVGEVDVNLQLVVQRLKASATEEFEALIKHTSKQSEGFLKVANEINDELINYITKQHEGFVKVTTELHDELLKQTIKQNENFEKITNDQNNKLFNHLVSQRESFEKVAIVQNELLVNKAKELSQIVEELKNLTAVKNTMLNLEKAAIDQNRKIDKLSDSIRELASLKSGISPSPFSSKWIKLMALVGGIILVASCLFFVVIQLLQISGL